MPGNGGVMEKSKRNKFIFVQALTWGRMPLILLTLLIVVAMSEKKQHMDTVWFIIAFASMILSAVTDLFDGYFARKFDVVTRIGGYLDPLTDKVFYLTAFPMLVYLAGLKDDFFHARLLLALAILFLLRDQWVSFLRSVGALYNVDAKANWSGKARTLISFPVICIVFYYLESPESWIDLPKWFIYTAEAASMVINLISIWVYTVYYWPWIKKEIAE